MCSSLFPWSDGYWYNKERLSHVFTINGENTEMKNIACIDVPGTSSMMKGKVSFGDFGPTSKEIMDLTGLDTYNLQWEITSLHQTTPAVLSHGGTRIHMRAWMHGQIDVLEWISEDQLNALREDREPADAPCLPQYITPAPQKMGKILWFSGPPGAGKSTSAQLMGRHHGYVYYEADCFLHFVNPFIDLHDPNPSLAQMSQKPLKGFDPKIIKSMQVVMDGFEGMLRGNFDGIDEIFQPFCDGVTDHIEQQRQQLGGHWAIAMAIMNRKQREKIRENLGQDLIFIVLKMTKSCVRKRLIARHGAENADHIVGVLEKMHSLYEDAGEDEQNSYNVVIDEDSSKEDVIAKVMKIIGKD